MRRLDTWEYLIIIKCGQHFKEIAVNTFLTLETLVTYMKEKAFKFLDILFWLLSIVVNSSFFCSFLSSASYPCSLLFFFTRGFLSYSQARGISTLKLRANRGCGSQVTRSFVGNGRKIILQWSSSPRKRGFYHRTVQLIKEEPGLRVLSEEITNKTPKWTPSKTPRHCKQSTIKATALRKCGDSVVSIIGVSIIL